MNRTSNTGLGAEDMDAEEGLNESTMNNNSTGSEMRNGTEPELPFDPQTNAKDNSQAAVTTCIEWRRGETSAVFLERHSALQSWKQNRSLDALLINDDFFTNYLQLSDVELEEITNILTNHPFKTLHLQSLPRAFSLSACRRLTHFCAMLGRMHSMKTIDICCEQEPGGGMNTTHVTIIRCMPFLQHLSIWEGHQADVECWRDLAAALCSQKSCLETVCLCIPSAHYAIVLPALYSIQSLSKVTLYEYLQIDDEELQDGEDELPPDTINAMAGLLRMGESNPDLRVELKQWQTFGQETQTTLCRALAETTIKGLELSYIDIYDPQMLASSLSQCQLKDLKLTHLEFDIFDSRAGLVLSSLSQVIHAMEQLEKLECGYPAGGQMAMEGDYKDAAVLQLVEAVAQCHRLEYLKFFLTYFPHEELDKALAACVDPVNDHLVHVHVCCYSTYSTETWRPKCLPMISKALQKNYTIQRIRLQTVLYLLEDCIPQNIPPWDPLLEKGIQIFPQLNRAGRRLAEETDGIGGTNVLGEVSNNLDCIFHYLRDIPTLCNRKAANGNAAGRQPWVQLETTMSLPGLLLEASRGSLTAVSTLCKFPITVLETDQIHLVLQELMFRLQEQTMQSASNAATSIAAIAKAYRASIYDKTSVLSELMARLLNALFDALERAYVYKGNLCMEAASAVVELAESSALDSVPILIGFTHRVLTGMRNVLRARSDFAEQECAANGFLSQCCDIVKAIFSRLSKMDRDFIDEKVIAGDTIVADTTGLVYQTMQIECAGCVKNSFMAVSAIARCVLSGFKVSFVDQQWITCQNIS
ncbi:hypothetical protein MPSEU_000927900 [Mayamaea pseudoterrestris]|nr:hypothetical protein MPSEU_000927900 [Mayamaea pseudoterrestris]